MLKKHGFAVALLISAITAMGMGILVLYANEEIFLWENLVLAGVYMAAVSFVCGAVGFITAKTAFLKSAAGSVIRGVVCALIAFAAIFGLLAVNTLAFNGTKNRLFLGIAFAVIFIMLFVMLMLLCKAQLSLLKGGKKALCLLLAAVIIAVSPAVIPGIMVLCMDKSVSVISYSGGTPIMATRRSYDFDNSSLIIGGYCCGDADNDEQLVVWAKEAGLDFLVSDNKTEQFLSACDKNELGVILEDVSNTVSEILLPRSFQHSDPKNYEPWFNISSDAYYANKAYSHKCIWGNGFVDEPSRLEFENIAKGNNAFYQAIDGKIAYTNMFPFARSTQLNVEADMPEIRNIPFLSGVDWINAEVALYKKFISEYINTVDSDYISFDIYPLLAELNSDGTVEKTTNGYWLRNLDILSEACRKTGRDLWVITQCCGGVDETAKLTEEDFAECSTRYPDTPEDIRWQYYVSLSFGAKSIINALYYKGWWDSETHMIDASKNRTDAYYAVQTVNKEVEAFTEVYGDYTHIGAFLTNGKKAAANKTNTLTPLEDASYKPEVASEAPILTGCFKNADGGSAYTFVNMWEPETANAASFTASFDGAEKITLYRRGETQIINGDTLELTLENSEGVFVTVE